MTLSHQKNAPLADRLRPKTLDEFIGQEHILGDNKVLRQAIETDHIISMILWGPPGVGKTSLARIIANVTKSEFITLSAVSSGVADVRKAISQAHENKEKLGKNTIVFIDEIHRFNKSQQDALLHSVENGTIKLVGATTENPSFEIISPLLSRCRVYKLESLTKSHLKSIIKRALTTDKIISSIKIDLSRDAESILLALAAGDARNVLSGLELAVQIAEADKTATRKIDRQTIEQAMQKRTLLYDKKGDYHYDVISAFIKSVRGSDPDAALYWLARMIRAGEDPKFIARRLLILASEDIGNADPHALMVANSAFNAVEKIGMPEGRIILAQATTYLASAPKSNASYLAINNAMQIVDQELTADVPLHLRNAPTRLMKEHGYAAGYKYPHDYNGFKSQNYFPEKIKNKVFYRPTENGIEKKIKDRLKRLWPGRKR